MNMVAEKITISQSMISMLDQLDFPYGIKNLESRYVYVNMCAVKLFGVKSRNDVIGKIDTEIKSKLTECDGAGEEFIEQDKHVFDNKKPLSTLEIHPVAIDYPYVVNKIPFFNDNNACVGVCLFSRPLDVYSLSDYVKGNMPGSLLLNKPDDFFTERECEVMFFRLQGLSSKETADRLCLSPRTIENYMRNLYEKTSVNRFDDFKEFCAIKGYDRYLPKRFFAKDHIIF